MNRAPISVRRPGASTPEDGIVTTLRRNATIALLLATGGAETAGTLMLRSVRRAFASS